ncbi:MAG: 2-dehydro-3-deoxy-D-gluconate 5-dehydrogenase KduD [Candidatus Sumerlaeaceae bacterium]
MSARLFNLEGTIALVTGASTGIGRAFCIALAQAGADIAGVGSSGNFAETQAAVEATGRKFIGITADLEKMDQTRTVVARALDAVGSIDVLVNNAGTIRRAPSLEFTEEDWDAVMNVNLKSAFFLAQAAARHFVEQDKPGKIINVASLLSFQGGILVPSYTASKSGLAGITKTLANEWASKNINVNAIAPGYIATRNTQALQDDPVRNKSILDRIPAGRWGKPEDLAGMVVFLASHASDYCHGTVYPVDGGWLGR